MKRSIIGLAVAAIVAVAPVNAAAPVQPPVETKTFDVGDLYGGAGTDGYSSFVPFTEGTTGAFQHTYTFSLTGPSIVHFGLGNMGGLSGLKGSMYRVGGFPAALFSLAPTSLMSFDPMEEGDSASWQSVEPMGTGDYRVEISGNHDVFGVYSLELSSDVAAPVPGPAGLVVAGVGGAVVAYRKRRKAKLQG